jgi:hypothetical protein
MYILDDLDTLTEQETLVVDGELADKTELFSAHANTISASNAHRIMGELDSSALPLTLSGYYP